MPSAEGLDKQAEVHEELPTPVSETKVIGQERRISAISRGKSWSGREDSNLRPLPPEDSALPG